MAAALVLAKPVAQLTSVPALMQILQCECWDAQALPWSERLAFAALARHASRLVSTFMSVLRLPV